MTGATMDQKFDIIGDMYSAECPACGLTLYDLWDLGIPLLPLSQFNCPHCGEPLIIKSTKGHVLTIGQLQT